MIMQLYIFVYINIIAKRQYCNFDKRYCTGAVLNSCDVNGKNGNLKQSIVSNGCILLQTYVNRY